MDQNQLVEALGNLSVLQIIALTKELEEKWGVKAAPAPVGLPPTGPTPPPNDTEQTEFCVILKEAGAKKVEVIKAVREATGLGLKEAKDLVDSAPKPVKEGISKADAEALRDKFTAAGAVVELK